MNASDHESNLSSSTAEGEEITLEDCIGPNLDGLGHFDDDARRAITQKLRGKDLKTLQEFGSGAGTCDSTLQHACGALRRAGLDDDAIQNQLQPLYEEHYPSDRGRAIPHALDSLDSTGTQDPDRPYWPQPEKVELDVVLATLASKGIKPIAERGAAEITQWFWSGCECFLAGFLHRCE